jgi:IPT/TIG domain-containing protein
MAITPNQGPTGGGSTVTITGTNLGGALAVHFDSEPATITANTDTSVNVITPADMGVAEVTVTTPAGRSGPVHFYYILPPVIESVVPTSGAAAGGGTVTINGRNLATATAVSFGGTTVTPTVVNDSQLTVVTPATAAGLVTLVVATRGGVADNVSFTFVSPPTLTSFSPISGSTAGGNTVTLAGTNLLTTTSVSFGGTPATFAVLSNTAVAAIAPAHALGTVSLAVTTTGGSATAPGTYLYEL